MNTHLTSHQKDFFNQNGYLVVENAVSADQLKALQDQFSDWVELSRTHTEAFGETVDGRPRFDLEDGHSPDTPALRRVNVPVEISDAYYEVMTSSRMVDSVAELIGPDVKFHHSKINSKLPGSKTEVKWHQDFPFTPHSNDDLITALLMVDEVTLENGPLQVVPGSHKAEIHGLWHDGRFTGSVDEEVTRDCIQKAVTCTGAAGSVCLMHTRLLHGSSANASGKARTLFISVYSAVDAIPLSPNPVPNKFEGLVVKGRSTGRIRAIPFDIALPELPRTASFFDQQAGQK